METKPMTINITAQNIVVQNVLPKRLGAAISVSLNVRTEVASSRIEYANSAPSTPTTASTSSTAISAKPRCVL